MRRVAARVDAVIERTDVDDAVLVDKERGQPHRKAGRCRQRHVGGVPVRAAVGRVEHARAGEREDLGFVQRIDRHRVRRAEDLDPLQRIRWRHIGPCDGAAGRRARRVGRLVVGRHGPERVDPVPAAGPGPHHRLRFVGRREAPAHATIVRAGHTDVLCADEQAVRGRRLCDRVGLPRRDPGGGHQHRR